MAPVMVWIGWIMLLTSALFRSVVCGVPLRMQRSRHVLIVLVLMSWIGVCVWIGAEPRLIAFVIAFIEIYHGFNVLRIVERRMHEHYLAKSVQETWQMLTIIEAFVIGLWWAYSRQFSAYKNNALTIFGVVTLFASIVLVCILVRNLRATKLIKAKHSYDLSELPTVTLAIPARNETDWLNELLRNALASDYPKLEIVVLDDCSQGETANIIKSFAHDGVRFVQGTAAPEEHWLQKNWAYQTLYENSSGEYIFFAGVDIRLDPHTIRNLISSMIESKKEMISIMPYRKSEAISDDLFHPLRNWWELVLPQRLLKRPPVLSTAWIIRRRTMKKLGSFKAITRSVIPEGYFARELNKSGDYAFYRSDESNGLTYMKGWREQIDTAIRTRYPQVRKKPELVAMVSTLVIASWIAPYVLLAYDQTRILSVCTIALLTAAHCTVEALTKEKRWWLGLFTFPILVPLEIILLNVSLYKYEFSKVFWKGRNICIPVMHATPRLPKI